MSDFKERIEQLKDMFEKDTNRNIFQRYIEYIRFPFYKNFSANMKIDFSFPVMFLVGANGTGKSSLLQALYGAPKNNNVGQYWFNTELDYISDLKNNRHCYIYAYLTPYTKTLAEVLRSRIGKRGNPNFWETAQPQARYGMEIFSKHDKDKRETRSTRWNPVDKNVVYLDFRREIGAFDKYFYFGEKPNTVTMKTKQDLIRRMSKYIKLSHNSNKQCTYYKNGVCKAPIILETGELAEINKILDKKYLDGKIFEHNLYDRSSSGTHDNMGFSVILKTNFHEYSEAFAGSGETVVVKLVHEIFTAEEFSLILLDEPETSLHPRAQRRLLDFLLKQTVEKHLQVVASTHSKDMIEGMPKEAIKAFYINEKDGKTSILQDVVAGEAFFYISDINDKINIIVEDKLAKMIIEAVLKSMGEANESLFDVKYYPGGDTAIKKLFIPIYSKNSGNKDIYVILDGDKRKPHAIVENILEKDLTEENLKNLIIRQTGVGNIEFPSDSGKSEQRISQMVDYLKYYKNNVCYLPSDTPEELIWNDAVLQKADIENEDKTAIKNINDIKRKYAKFSEYMFGSSGADDIEKAHKYFLKRWLEAKDDSYDEMVKILNKIKDNNQISRK
jgi:predicted ATPase